jgi:hypothetical protein
VVELIPQRLAHARADGNRKTRALAWAESASETEREQALAGAATITGVGFLDIPHAYGAARNGIELHPVLAFRSRYCALSGVESGKRLISRWPGLDHGRARAYDKTGPARHSGEALGATPVLFARHLTFRPVV